MPPPTRVRTRRRERVTEQHPAPPVRRPAPARRRPAPAANQLAQRSPVRDRAPTPGASNQELARVGATAQRDAVPPERVGPPAAPQPAPAPPTTTTAPVPAPAPTEARAPAPAPSPARAPARAPARTRRFAAQAAVIEADHRAKQAQAQRIVARRAQEVTAAFAAVRTGLTLFVLLGLARVQARVVTGQARLQAVVTGVVAALGSVVASVAQTLAAHVAQVVQTVAAVVTRAVAAARTGVRAVASRITGLIGSISLPDVPGVAAIRARAVRFLAGAAGFVTARLDDVAALVRRAASAAVALAGLVIGGAMVLVQGVLAAVSTTLRRLVAVVALMLLRLAIQVGLALRHVLAVVLRLLARVHVLVLLRLIGVLAQALRLLRRNRDLALATLEELARLRPLPRAAGPGTPPDPEAEQDAWRVVLVALLNSTRVVRLLDLVTGAAVPRVLAAVRAVVTRIAVRVLLRIAQLLARVTATVAAALAEVGRVVGFAVTVLRSVLDAVRRTLTAVVDALRAAIQAPLDSLLALAVAAVARVRDLVTSLVRRLVAGLTEVLGDLGSLLFGATRQATVTGPVTASGPIIVPPPPPVLAPILKGLLFFVAVIGAIVIAKFAFLAPVVAFLLALGLSEYAVVVVIGLAVLVLALLLLVLLVLLLRALLRRRRPPVKRVTAVRSARPEVGVGGRDLRVAARIAPGSPAVPRIRWTINPGGIAPAAIRVLGSTPVADVRAGHPPFGTVTGGVPITVRAELASNPADFADLVGLMVVQVTQAHYDARPPLFATPPNSDPFPPNTVDPNRDGVAGSSAEVVATTAPAGRPVLVRLRRPLGAVVAGTTITPGATTGDILVRVVDDPTGALLDERRPSLLNPPVLMSTLVVDAVPTRVRRLRFLGRLPAGPYSALNDVVFEPSDTRHPPLTRLVGELITLVRDDFSLPPPNGAFNPGFVPALAAPARFWQDQLVTPAGMPHTGDGRVAIDVNRFVGPGVPALPRAWIFRQRMVWVAWRGGNVVSVPIADGQHLRTLVKRFVGFGFTTHHTFPGTSSTPPAEPYAGPPLIVLTRIRVTPVAAGATALAADGAALGNAVLTTTVAGRQVTWTVPAGGISVPAGNPSIPPAAATVRAGAAPGRFALRAQDTIYGNRQVDGSVLLRPVVLRRLSVGLGFGATRTVSVTADPGGRLVRWTLDPAAVAAGVVVAPPTTGPGPARSTVTVTRPAGFVGTVVVTATDSVVAAATASTSIRFR